MRNAWDEKYIRCPLYRDRGKCTITCEGTVCRSTELRFISNKERDRHVDRYCKRDYEKCLQYRGVCKKYE